MPTPKSKEAKRKIRRWTFLITATNEDGTKKTFIPPALTIGDLKQAKTAADEIKRDVETLPNLKGAKIKVEPQGNEVVSREVLGQIQGLEQQAQILTRALKEAVESYLDENIATTGFTYTAEQREKEVSTLIGKFVVRSQEKQRDELLRAQGIDPDAITDDVIEDPVQQLEIPLHIGGGEPEAEAAAAEPFPDGEFGQEVAA